MSKIIASIRTKVLIALISCLTIGIIAIPQCLAAQKYTQVADAGNAQITVPSTRWVNTGTTVNSGDTLKVSANGLWSASQNVGSTKPDGYAQEKADNFLNIKDIGTCTFCASTKTPYWGALIGYIGNNSPVAGSYTSRKILPEARKVFFVGSNLRTSAKFTGKLWLTFNDDAYSGYTRDNSGQVSAKVAVVGSICITTLTAVDNAPGNWYTEHKKLLFARGTSTDVTDLYNRGLAYVSYSYSGSSHGYDTGGSFHKGDFGIDTQSRNQWGIRTRWTWTHQDFTSYHWVAMWYRSSAPC